MAKYHDYVFDLENRKFLGQFEEMYREESSSGFDSWHQDDSRWLSRKICLSVLEQWNFKSIVDFGCGKGQFTHMLKRRNNSVLGVDVSPTAIKIAKERFPDIDFSVSDINDLGMLDALLCRHVEQWSAIELCVVSECLSYLTDWQKVLEKIAARTDYLLISLYIPVNPIGYVKSVDSLLEELAINFEALEVVRLQVSGFVIFFGKSKIQNGSRIL